MNLETLLPESLWEAIRINYEKRDFTAAILDCCYFISDLLRQRSGVDGDGATLIGQALGGANPKIKLAKDQSETEINVQRGVENILRGFYQAIRNPRSHRKINDNADDALSIIMFSGYIVRLIQQARAPASREALLSRILDKDFVPNERYAQLLVEEIPPGMRMDVFLLVYERKSDWKPSAIQYYNRYSMERMTPEERSSVFALISDELATTDDEKSIRQILGGFAPDIWPSLSEVARLRIEHKIALSIAEGRFEHKSQRCTGGALATWAVSHIRFFTSQSRVASTLYNKMAGGDSQGRAYVEKYFLYVLVDSSPEYMRKLDELFTRKLKEGVEDFYYSLMLSPWKQEQWSKSLIEAYNNFKAKEEIPDLDDDIPF